MHRNAPWMWTMHNDLLSMKRFWQKWWNMTCQCRSERLQVFYLFLFRFSLGESYLPQERIFYQFYRYAHGVKLWGPWPTASKKLIPPANNHINMFGSWFYNLNQALFTSLNRKLHNSLDIGKGLRRLVP